MPSNCLATAFEACNSYLPHLLPPVFWSCFIGIEWFPEFIAPTLTGISIFCLAKRDSPWFTRIFGGAVGNEGLGLFAFCFDWNYVGSGGYSIGAFFTALNSAISLFGILIHNCLLRCVCQQCLGKTLFYENGTPYDQLAILDENFRLDKTSLEVQGLPWFVSSQVLSNIGTNLSIGATITHVVLWYGKDILEVIRQYRVGVAYDAHLAEMKVIPRSSNMVVVHRPHSRPSCSLSSLSTTSAATARAGSASIISSSLLPSTEAPRLWSLCSHSRSAGAAGR
ncbi:hypothetical protein DFH07DRAFT_810241 [Mycena maculata]|uniref:Uncharacterized protein n=1 Tax=Mycena maculata TaxID=230809 RepID=A0AAD7JJ58_9AGAR|nr:hypothetical protein DFH07DRAFT_810241 [Mycena maculata]